jgi:hypothetical protein
MKVYYQGIMDWLDNEIHRTSDKQYMETTPLVPKYMILQDVRDNINRIIKEEHQKIMKETDE